MMSFTKDIADDQPLQHRQKAKEVSANKERNDIVNRRLPKYFRCRGFFNKDNPQGNYAIGLFPKFDP
jgi:hypothetical protein